MTFVLTLFYIAFSLLSVDVLPDFLGEIHIIWILGVLLILGSIPGISRSGLLKLPNTYLVTGILFAATLSIAGTGWLGGALDTFIGFVPIIFTYYFIVIGFQKPGRLIAMTYVLFAVLLFILVQGTRAEMTGNFVSPYLIQEGLSGGLPLYRHRGLGVLSDPNDLAQVLVTTLPLLWLRWKKDAMASNLLLTILPAAVLMFGVYQTHSRGGIVALIAVMIYAFKDKLGLVKGGILAGVCSMAVLALGFAGGRNMSNDDGERVSLWGQALEVFKSHPLFGIGMGRFADYSDIGLTAHNSYVLCLAELGIIGYFFWMGSIVVSWNGLSSMLPKKRKPAVDGEDPQDTDGAPVQAEEPAMAGMRRSMQSVSAPSFALAGSGAMAFSPAGGAGEIVLPASLQGNPYAEEEEHFDEEQLVYSAKILHAAFVGLLVSAFFLSRTYSMIFYVLFGMTGALQRMYGTQHPEVRVALMPLFKRVALIIVGSIVALSLFVRLHGV